MDEILGYLDDEKLRELLVAAAERNLGAAAMHMIGALADDGLIRVGARLADLTEAQQETLARELLGDREFQREAERLIERSPEAVRVAIDQGQAELNSSPGH